MIEYIDEDIQEVMEITGLDKTKAEKLFKSVAKDFDDDEETTSFDIIDIIKTEQKTKENNSRHYVTSEKPKTERKPKEKKIDEEKKKIIEIIAKALVENGYGAEITNVDKTIDFDCYTVNLVKHRPPKK